MRTPFLIAGLVTVVALTMASTHAATTTLALLNKQLSTLDKTLTPEQKRAKAREILQAARTEARSTLTPEQQKRAHRMRDRMQAMRQHRRKL